MILDTFLYFNELQLLRLRLEHMENIVDRHVILESTHTFSGNRKGLSLDLGHPLIAPFRDRITLIKSTANIGDVYPDDKCLSYWTREFFQRSILHSAVSALAQNGDMILVADLDQLPKLDRWEECVDMASTLGIACMRLDQHLYYMNRRVPNIFINNNRLCSLACYVSPPRARSTMDPVLKRSKPYLLHYFHSTDHDVEDCGWHFSSVGGKDALLLKMASYSHAGESYIPEKMAEAKDHLDEVVANETVEVERSSLPQCVQSRWDELVAQGFILEH